MFEKAEQLEKFLEKYTSAFGPTSFEDDVAELVREDLGNLADEITRDGLGSIIALKKGTGTPRIMVAGHMDEVGFIVKGITKSGYVKVNPLGGWWTHNLLGQKVIIRTREKGDIIGIFGSKAPHSLKADERKKLMELEDLYVDIGVTDENPKLPGDLGIEIGDPVVPMSEFHKMGKDGKMLMAKAWDNRIGVIIMVMVMQELAKRKHPNKYFGVGTVQEEVGLRGAGTSAFVVKPDIAFAVDVTLAADVPGAANAEWGEKLGKGPSISVIDSSLIPNPRLRNFVIDVAKECEIPYQLGSLARGGTDGGRIALTGEGCPTITLSIATRYIHSHNSVLHLDDVKNLVKLLTEVIVRLDTEKVGEIRYS